MSDTATVDLDTREQHWSYEQMVRLGVEPESARALVFARVEWHEVKRLLDNGCPVHLAVEILR